MFVRPIHVRKNGKRHAYWALVESYRTDRGPRQRVVAYLGQMDEAGRLGVRAAADGRRSRQGHLFEAVRPAWVEVDVNRIRVERCRAFGGPWLGRELMRRLGLLEFFERVFPAGREAVCWAAMAQILVLARLCDPSSELHIAEHVYAGTALEDLVGVPAALVNDDRLYRALDRLLVHKADLEAHLKRRLGELFDLKYDLLLYDITSTYFEGEAAGNALAARGYSRDHRPDCKQVLVALVVTREGYPLGYEVFAGNRTDVTTVEEVVTTMECRYGRADRIWVMDRGMVSEEKVSWLKAGGRRYILGTPKAMLRRFERQMLDGRWETVREGLEVQRCPSPDGAETFILCRSRARQEKERAIHERFEKRIEKGLAEIEEGCRRRRQDVVTVAKRLGRLLGQNTRAAGLFRTDVAADADGRARLVWSKVEGWRRWATLSEGCYLLRTNIQDWSAADLWTAYMQLSEAEGAFRIHKSDLELRPVWHQKQGRVEAHILVCFLAYVLWRTLGGWCRQAHLGDEPRRVLEELSKIRVVDVVVPTRNGPEIRRRCITRPTDHQAILLQHLGLTLPPSLRLTDEKAAAL
jgi:transposase